MLAVKVSYIYNAMFLTSFVFAILKQGIQGSILPNYFEF